MTLDRQELSSHRKEWTDYFKEFCFQESLTLCRWTMIAQDLKAISQLHVNLAVVNSEEDLLPEPLADFMELEEIEQRFSRLLTDHHPMAEDLEDKPVKVSTQTKVETVVQPMLTPAKKVAVEKVESKKNTVEVTAQALKPKSQLSLTDQPTEEFSIRRGEKTRKILARLRALGFLPRGRRGSHEKLENKEGQQVIVASGGKRKHQKAGTAGSISSQVNAKA